MSNRLFMARAAYNRIDLDEMYQWVSDTHVPSTMPGFSERDGFGYALIFMTDEAALLFKLRWM